MLMCNEKSSSGLSIFLLQHRRCRVRSKVLGRIVRILQFTIGTCFPDNSRVIPIFIAVILCAPRPTGIDRRIDYQPFEHRRRTTVNSIDNPSIGDFISIKGSLHRIVLKCPYISSRILVICKKILFRSLHPGNRIGLGTTIMETGNGQRRRIPFIEIGSRTVRVGVYIRRIPIEELEISLAQVERAGIVLLVG